VLAFVIAKLLNNHADYSRKLSHARELVRRAQRVRDAASIRYFEWYNDRVLDDAIDEVMRRVRHLYEPLEEALRDVVLPEYLDTEAALQTLREAVAKDQREAEERERAARERRTREAAGRGIGALNMNNELTLKSFHFPTGAEIQGQALRNAALEKEVADEREALRRLSVDVSDSIRDIKAFSDELTDNPESSRLISTILGGGFVLFLVGVIYPLSFLPVPPRWDRALSVTAFASILFSIRGAILTLAVIVFGSVMLVLWITNARLRYPDHLLADLTRWSAESSYSEYLAVRKTNKDKQVAAVAGARPHDAGT
jgi:hypothetical protein